VTAFLCDYAWLPDGIRHDVVLEVSSDGRISSVSPVSSAGAGAVRLPGLTVPGFANAHSHAFHRALRGRTHHDRGTFWTWRDLMYAVADRLDPDSYYRLARAVYAEMAMAGVTCVGEFHYLHHAPGGVRYADPNAMGEALIAAAADAGIRITLLDTLYLQAGVDGAPLAGPQLRFGDGSLDGWASRVSALTAAPHALIGAAIHSVRAVPADALAKFSSAGPVEALDGPVHAHVSEQVAENEACRAFYGCTPVELLARHGILGPDFSAVHATHLTGSDIELLSGSTACFCPTTERDLGDGIGPARRLADSGVRLTLGSDSHAVIDPLEETRALELNERLAARTRGHFTQEELLRAATVDGHRSLGWDDAGSLAVGMRTDLVSLSLESVRTAGIELSGVLMAATAADITHVVVDGRVVVAEGRHIGVDAARELTETVCALF
jgi:formiminoglutamate deiminase